MAYLLCFLQVLAGTLPVVITMIHGKLIDQIAKHSLCQWLQINSKAMVILTIIIALSPLQ